METLVVVAEHRNQYYSRCRNLRPARFGSFGSPPPRQFKEINCRTFQSGTGLLPTPLKACTSPATKQKFPPALSPKTPSPSSSVRAVKSISVPSKMKFDFPAMKVSSFNHEFCYSELWAGPTYSNSPPPSSLPIPKFSVRPKRTVSLELPASASAIDLRPITKSAPSSPTREHSSSPIDKFETVDSATKVLCRILNVDMDDE